MTEPVRHTNKLNECFINDINRIAEISDNEYYMSALGPPLGTLERAKRGRSRILEAIDELRKIDQKTTCSVCHEEIITQIQRQANGVLEINNIWNL